jgi:DNA-binding NtrC family response regulator
MGRVLIVSDEPQRPVLALALEQSQHVVMQAAGIEEAGRTIGANQFDAILAQEKLQDGTAADVLALSRATDGCVGVILLSATGTCERATASLQQGFSDFLSTPVAPEVLRTVLQRACERSTLLRENTRLREELGKRGGPGDPLSLGWIEALPPSLDMRSFLAAVEKSLIERTLQATRGAQAEAARRLGLSRSDLSYKLLKYELRKETTATSQ